MTRSSVRTDNTKSPGLLCDSRTRKDPFFPLSIINRSASFADKWPWNHLYPYFTINIPCYMCAFKVIIEDFYTNILNHSSKRVRPLIVYYTIPFSCWISTIQRIFQLYYLSIFFTKLSTIFHVKLYKF